MRALAWLLIAGAPTLPRLAAQAAPNTANPTTVGDFQAIDAGREAYQSASGIIAALRLSSDDWVADVGAGAGYYSMRLAEIVGSGGKVIAEDISDASIRWLAARVKVFDLANVEVLKGTAEDPRLPAGRLEAVLVVDAYHHFTNCPAMLKEISRSLKPGGRLVIADYSFADHRAATRAEQVKLHEISPDLVRAELGSAGFRVQQCEDPFVKWRPGVGNTRASATDLWLMTATRSK